MSKTLKQTVQATQPDDIDLVVSAYAELTASIKELEKRKAELRTILEIHADHVGGDFQSGEYKVTLATVSTERFDLKTASKVMDRKILEPFISVSSYNRLTVKR